MKIASVLILLIFLSLSLSVSKQHLILSTYEFMVVKSSSRVAVFFIFNVIIITIFRGTKPSTEDFDWFLSFPRSVNEADGTKDEATCEDYDGSGIEEDDEYHDYDGDNDDDGSEEDFDSEDEQDKDLERRIEEFITKNYKQRREESIYERLLCMAATELHDVSSPKAS